MERENAVDTGDLQPKVALLPDSHQGLPAGITQVGTLSVQRHCATTCNVLPEARG
jgi:hypothetical protein